MKHHLCLFLATCFLAACLLAGCISVNINLPIAPTVTPVATFTPPEPDPLLPTATPDQPEPTEPNLMPTPTEYVPLITPTVDLTAVPPQDSPARSLYFLHKSALWVLRPNAGQAKRLTAEDSLVTTFDVWPEDGRIAYGTRSGKLYIIMPGQDPRLLVKLPDDGPYPAYLTGVDWSPDGSQLAYTVDLDSKGQGVKASYPSSPSGLWITPREGGKSTWLMSNRYPSGAAGDDINLYRRLSDPQWSPDGQALLLRGQYWEWSKIHWLYPLAFAEDDRNLHSFESANPSQQKLWNQATWLPDSSAVLLAGEDYTTLGGLGYALRDGSRSEMWVTGEGSNLYIYAGYLVPAGSYVPASSNYLNAGPGRVLYLASCPVCQNNHAARLFIQNSPLADQYQNGEIIGPESLCTRNDQFGNLNQPRLVEWQPDFSLGVLTCGSNEIYLLNLHRGSPEQSDLLPALPPLDPGEVPIFRWGEL